MESMNSGDLEKRNVSNNLKDTKDLSARAKNALLRSGIFTLSDLIGFVDDNELSSLRNVGVKTISEIEAFIERHKDDVIEMPAEVDENNIDYSSQPWNEELDRSVEDKTKDTDDRVDLAWLIRGTNEAIASLDINKLMEIGVSQRQCKYLQKAGFYQIGDLGENFIIEIREVARGGNADFSNHTSAILCYHLSILLKKELTASSDSRAYRLVLLKAKGQSLQIIGEIEKITRERVRQIIKKYLRSLSPLINCIVNCMFDQKGYATIKEIQNLCDDEAYRSIIPFWCKDNVDILYIEEDNICVPTDERNMMDIAEELDCYTTQFVGDGIQLNELIEELSKLLFEKGYYHISAGNVISYMLRHGYCLCGNYIFHGLIGYAELCVRTIAKKFVNGIKLRDNYELELLRGFVRDEYGDIDLPSNDGKLRSALSEYLLLRGKGVYIPKEKAYVEPQLLDELKVYIDNQMDSVIYYSDLYKRFEAKIRMMSNIDNRYFLQGVLQLHFGDCYEFHHSDYLKIPGKHWYRPWYSE